MMNNMGIKTFNNNELKGYVFCSELNKDNFSSVDGYVGKYNNTIIIPLNKITEFGYYEITEVVSDYSKVIIAKCERKLGYDYYQAMPRDEFNILMDSIDMKFLGSIKWEFDYSYEKCIWFNPKNNVIIVRLYANSNGCCNVDKYSKISINIPHIVRDKINLRMLNNYIFRSDNSLTILDQKYFSPSDNISIKNIQNLVSDENNILWDTLPKPFGEEDNIIEGMKLYESPQWEDFKKIFSEDNIKFKKICEKLERNDKNENNN